MSSCLIGEKPTILLASKMAWRASEEGVLSGSEDGWAGMETDVGPEKGVVMALGVDLQVRFC